MGVLRTPDAASLRNSWPEITSRKKSAGLAFFGSVKPFAVKYSSACVDGPCQPAQLGLGAGLA